MEFSAPSQDDFDELEVQVSKLERRLEIVSGLVGIDQHWGELQEAAWWKSFEQEVVGFVHDLLGRLYFSWTKVEAKADAGIGKMEVSIERGPTKAKRSVFENSLQTLIQNAWMQKIR